MGGVSFDYRHRGRTFFGASMPAAEVTRDRHTPNLDLVPTAGPDQTRRVSNVARRMPTALPRPRSRTSRDDARGPFVAGECGTTDGAREIRSTHGARTRRASDRGRVRVAGTCAAQLADGAGLRTDAAVQGVLGDVEAAASAQGQSRVALFLTLRGVARAHRWATRLAATAAIGGVAGGVGAGRSTEGEPGAARALGCAVAVLTIGARRATRIARERIGREVGALVGAERRRRRATAYARGA